MRLVMSDIIRLLPDSIANQIAAGEVVQRPASVVKELLENAIDAGATLVELIIKDGGQNSIKIIDNGKGMSEIDARMCWERHATSKIRETNDLFKINTFGFRGEALASIAAIAQVHLYTKQESDDLGTHVLIEASDVKLQEPCTFKTGTSIEVRNLFFNVPARRNFLKSTSVETKHILEEFQRVALANPDVAFKMHNADSKVYDLPISDQKQRLKDVLGKKKSEELHEIDEHTDLITIKGFVGSPAMAKRTRGDQFIFVNGRFIRHAYFNHAIVGAYDELIESDAFPFYVLFLEVDPSSIDINVHPTKTEVKFEDAQSIYKILRSVVQQALALSMNTPQLDFDSDVPSRMDYQPNITTRTRPPEPKVDKNYNPFEKTGSKREGQNLSRWEKLYEPLKHQKREEEDLPEPEAKPVLNFETSTEKEVADAFQYHNGYIVCTLEGSLYIINQQAAHERILYERFIQAGDHASYPSQQLLFPRTIEFNQSDFELVKDLMDEINNLGFDISIFGKNAIIVNGTPADSHKSEAEEMIEGLLERYKVNAQQLKLDKRENIARAMAVHSSIKRGQKLEPSEMQQIVSDLFQTTKPSHTPGGKPIFVNFDETRLKDIFKIRS